MQGQQIVAEQLKEHGWQLFCGHHQDSRSGGVWDAPQGGVAIMVRQGWAARLIKPEKGDELANALWTSTRFVHVHLMTGNGATAMNVISCYGVPRNRQLNDDLFQLVVKYTIRLGNVPLILAGDFNFELDSQGSYPLAVLN